jgi:8-oxo-dGTP pyrophosphatase MutT (NUDIX family)
MDIPAGMLPLRVDGVTVGWLGEDWLERALEAPTPFDMRGDALWLLPALRTYSGRSAALAEWAVHARRQGWLPGWRDERMVVLDGERPLFGVERALLRPLGLMLRSVQACCYTMTVRGPMLWVAHRADTKPVDPGRLDVLVAGGIQGLDDPRATLLRECAEEAGIPPELAEEARPAGALELCYPTHDHGLQVLHRERVALYELELPAGFEPSPVDGEHERIEAMTPAEAIASIETGRWTRDGAQASTDLILRHGWMPARQS